MVKHNKLVRDNIPAIIRSNNGSCIFSTLNDGEFKTELNKKLKEECDEFLEASNLNELADILEVVYAIANSYGMSESRLNSIRRSKATKNGAFEDKIYLIETYDKPHE